MSPKNKRKLDASWTSEMYEGVPKETETATDGNGANSTVRRKKAFIFTILRKWTDGGYQFDLDEALETIKKQCSLEQAQPTLNFLSADFAASGDMEGIRKVTDTISFLQQQEKQKAIGQTNPGEFFEPLRNSIFDRDLFNSLEKLHKLRNTIAVAIDMDDNTGKYGKPQEVRINPIRKNEWFYIMKAIEEAGICNSGIKVPDFIDQMMEWYPELFKDMTPKQRDAFKRKCSKSFTAERTIWKSDGEEVTLKDMWFNKNKQVEINLGTKKANRIYKIASSGLYLKLTELKRSIVRQENGWN